MVCSPGPASIRVMVFLDDRRDTWLLADPGSLLRPAVAGAGGELRAARPTQVRTDSAGRTLVRYATTVRWSDGQERTETFGAVSAPNGALPGGLVVVGDDDGRQVGVWRYPYDPFLPGLAHVATPDAAGRLLSRMDVPACRSPLGAQACT